MATTIASTHYYVSPAGNDSNDGSACRPWATIQHAADVISAGATVHVAEGTYNLSSTLNTNKSGTSSARIHYVSDVHGGAKLVVRAGAGSNAWSNNGNYVDIEGFDVTGDGDYGIANYGSFNRMIGNIVHNIPATGCTSNGGAGLVNANYSASDNDVIGNIVHDIGNYNTPCPRVHGIYHANLRGHILNNITYRNQGWGIHLWHAANNAVVSNNTVFNNAYGGIIIGDGDAPGGITNDYTTVSNNIVYKNGLVSGAQGYGIEEYGETGTNNKYVNNLVYQNGPANWRLQNGNTHLSDQSWRVSKR